MKKKIIPLLGTVILVPSICVGSLYGWYKATQFRASQPSAVTDDIYRMNRPSKEDINRVVEAIGVKSVLSLTGERHGEQWFDEMLEETNRLNGNHYHEGEKHEGHDVTIKFYALSASKFPSPKDLSSIADDLEDLEKPLLIHCRAGVDRTGLVSEIARIMSGSNPERSANYWGFDSHLSFWRGYFPVDGPFGLWASDTEAMDELLEEYKADFRESQIDIKEWITEVYPSVYESWKSRNP